MQSHRKRQTEKKNTRFLMAWFLKAGVQHSKGNEETPLAVYR